MEFYDLEEDPWEKVNLAQNIEFADEIESHRFELQRWMEANGDRGLQTEMKALDHMNPRIIDRIRARFGEHALPGSKTRP